MTCICGNSEEHVKHIECIAKLADRIGKLEAAASKGQTQTVSDLYHASTHCKPTLPDPDRLEGVQLWRAVAEEVGDDCGLIKQNLLRGEPNKYGDVYWRNLGTLELVMRDRWGCERYFSAWAHPKMNEHFFRQEPCDNPTLFARAAIKLVRRLKEKGITPASNDANARQ